MSSLLGDERGPSQGDEMTFANIAGVLPAIDKVTDTSIYHIFIIHYSYKIAVIFDVKPHKLLLHRK